MTEKFNKLKTLYDIQGEIEIKKITKKNIIYLLPFTKWEYIYDYDIQNDYSKIVVGLFDDIQSSLNQMMGALDDTSNEIGRIRSKYEG